MSTAPSTASASFGGWSWYHLQRACQPERACEPEHIQQHTTLCVWHACTMACAFAVFMLAVEQLPKRRPAWGILLVLRMEVHAVLDRLSWLTSVRCGTRTHHVRRNFATWPGFDPFARREMYKILKEDKVRGRLGRDAGSLHAYGKTKTCAGLCEWAGRQRL